MRLLLDTHFLIYITSGGGELRPAERRAIDSLQNAIGFSAVSIWEIRIKWSTFSKSGARKLIVSPQAALEMATEAQWRSIPLTAQHAETTLDHPLSHKDPFDELLLAQAQAEGMRLFTRDRLLEHHPLALYA